MHREPIFKYLTYHPSLVGGLLELRRSCGRRQVFGSLVGARPPLLLMMRRRKRLHITRCVLRYLEQRVVLLHHLVGHASR